MKVLVPSVVVTWSSTSDGSWPRIRACTVTGRAAVLSKNSADLDFESIHDTQIDLRCSAVVETKHSAEALNAFDFAKGHPFASIP